MLAFLVACAALAAAMLAPAASAVVVRSPRGQLLGVTPQRGVAADHLGTLAVPHIASAQSSRPSSAQPQQLSGDMTSHGGPVLHSSAPYLVFWAPPGYAIPSDWPPLLQKYFTDVASAGSASAGVFAVDRQYYDAAGYADASQTFSASQVIQDGDPYPAHDSATCTETAFTCITDAQVRQELTQLMTTQGLPADGTANPSSFGPNAPIYLIVLPPNVDECFSAGDCAAHDYCSYHSSFVDPGQQEVLYDVIPSVVLSSPSTAKNCQIDGNQALQEPNGSLADVMLKYLTHDAAETITDPLLNGWWSAVDNNNEVADNCNQYGEFFDPSSGSDPRAFTPYLGGSTGGTLHNQALGSDYYYLQGVWTNTRGDCALQPAPAAVNAQFAATSSPPYATNTTLSFDPTSSTSPKGYSSVTWNWGDGSATQFNPGAPAKVTHRYASSGTYTVTLTIVDTEGNVAAASRTITVYSPPTATFTLSPAQPYAGDSSIFDASGSSDPDRGVTIVDYSWSFGDGSTISGPTRMQPAHTYTAPGTYSVSLSITNSAGLTSRTSQAVTVVTEPPQAGFTIQPTGAKVNEQVAFTASAGDAGYTWNFGDGTPLKPSSASNMASHAYAASGIYTVTLTSTTSNGTQTTVMHQLTVGPLAAFSYSPGQPSNGNQITFDGAESTDPDEQNPSITYVWSFGDGSPSGGGENVPHTYGRPGTYPVTLTVTNGLGETNSVLQHVTVSDTPPTASFSTRGVATPGGPVDFDATTSAPSDPTATLTYAWSFGDGASGTGVDPTHTYAGGGTYTVTLTVTDSHGTGSTISHQVVVHPPPVATFNYSPSQPFDGSQITFDGSGSSDPESGQAISSYAWDFGDGITTAATQSPRINHTYAKPGTYAVTLTAANGFGQTSSISQIVTVNDVPPTAGFSTTTPLATPGQPVGFAATATPSDPSAWIAAYAWSFGDGTSDAGPAPAHPYAAPGTYTVTLIVTDSDGTSSTVSHQVVVHALPVSAFSASPGYPLAGTPVSFNAVGSRDPEAGVGLTSFAWRFGDGSTASGVSPSHTYGPPGTYTVALTTVNSLGLSATTTQRVTVVAPPRVTVSLKTARPASGQPVAFAAAPAIDPAASVVAYSWTFGDRSGPVAGPSPTHVYKRPGAYTASLTITDSFGHSATATARVTVKLSGQISKVSLTRVGNKLLVTLNSPGVLSGEGRTLKVKKPGKVTMPLRFTAAQRRRLAETHTLTLHVVLRFAPAAGPRQTRTVIIVFRPHHAPAARMTRP